MVPTQRGKQTTLSFKRSTDSCQSREVLTSDGRYRLTLSERYPPATQFGAILFFQAVNDTRRPSIRVIQPNKWGQPEPWNRVVVVITTGDDVQPTAIDKKEETLHAAMRSWVDGNMDMKRFSFEEKSAQIILKEIAKKPSIDLSVVQRHFHTMGTVSPSWWRRKGRDAESVLSQFLATLLSSLCEFIAR
jgi:hypothetical protein